MSRSLRACVLISILLFVASVYAQREVAPGDTIADPDSEESPDPPSPDPPEVPELELPPPESPLPDSPEPAPVVPNPSLGPVTPPNTPVPSTPLPGTPTSDPDGPSVGAPSGTGAVAAPGPSSSTSTSPPLPVPTGLGPNPPAGSSPTSPATTEPGVAAGAPSQGVAAGSANPVPSSENSTVAPGQGDLPAAASNSSAPGPPPPDPPAPTAPEAPDDGAGGDDSNTTAPEPGEPDAGMRPGVYAPLLTEPKTYPEYLRQLLAAMGARMPGFQGSGDEPFPDWDPENSSSSSTWGDPDSSSTQQEVFQDDKDNNTETDGEERQEQEGAEEGEPLKLDDGSSICTSVPFYGASNPYGVHHTFLAASEDRSYERCTAGFTTRGRASRSFAVILVRWTREYYPKKAECCNHLDPFSQQFAACDCEWGGAKYEEIPTMYPPRAFERLFTDECDGRSSVNRAFYDMSGGAVTFGTNETGAREDSRVNVYGWATLPLMRSGPKGKCIDWCAAAMRQLGVHPYSHKHYGCLALYSPSGPRPGPPVAKAICNNACKAGQPCSNSCPAGSSIKGGCGCGTCYFGWGQQLGCGAPSNTPLRIGLAAPLSLWGKSRWVVSASGVKSYLAHEVGHNLGFSHTGSIKCGARGNRVERKPQGCTMKPYGDCYSMMGCGGNFNVPNVLRYRAGWLSWRTLATFPTRGTYQYTLWAANSLRPSNPEQAGLGWWTNQLLTVRISIKDTGGGAVSMNCPCNPGNTCPRCDARAPGWNPATCSASPCCFQPQCFVNGGGWYYVEYYRPYASDYRFNQQPPMVVIRAGGDLPDPTCKFTTLVVPAGSVATNNPNQAQVRWSLVKEGDVFRDDLRGVYVTLTQLNGNRAVITVRKD